MTRAVCFFFFFLPWLVSAQAPNDSLQKLTKSFGGHATDGYQIILTAPYKKVRKAYWDYLSTFTRPMLKQNHWVLYLPVEKEYLAEKKRISVFYAHVAPGKVGSILYLGVSSQFSVRAKEQWEEEIAHALLSFRLYFYGSELQETLVENEKKYRKKTKHAALLMMRREKLKRKIDRYEAHPRLEAWEGRLEETTASLMDLQREMQVLINEKNECIRSLSQIGGWQLAP